MRWMLFSLCALFVGCDSSPSERCEEFYEIACSCGDDPDVEGESPSEACYTDSEVWSFCGDQSTSDDGQGARWRCFSDLWRESCDYDEAQESSDEECE